MALEVCVAVAAMAVIEPVFRFDRPFFDSLENKRLIDIVLAVSRSSVAKRADQRSEDRKEFWRTAPKSVTSAIDPVLWTERRA
jgi:hypothetical protein